MMADAADVMPVASPVCPEIGPDIKREHAAAEIAPKRQRREVSADAAASPDYAAASGAMEEAEAAAGALAEAAADSVLESAILDEPPLVRLRGLPWSYGTTEVCQFFEGLGIKVPAETVTMLHNAAGEAFIALENPGQMDDVMKANRQQVGKRYVECFGASVAEREQAFERNQATMKDDAGYRGVLRMRGLPYNTTTEDIVEFFGSPPELDSSNVHLLRRSDGRASGDAYAVFDTEEAATEALKFDKQKLGNRWIDLFRSSKGELYSITALGGIMLPSSEQAVIAPATTSALGEGHTVVKLRGLPWGVTPEDIATFLSPIGVPEGGVHLMNGGNGRPSGIAYVELNSEDDQKEAVAKDKQSIGGRYIDVFPCSQTELQARLAGGLERGNMTAGAMVSGSDSEFVKLRGLPYSVQEHEIISFFQPLPVIAVQVAYNQSGQPSGFGFVQFRSSEDANAALGRSNQVLGSRYVEIFRCTRVDMEQAHVQSMSVRLGRGYQTSGSVAGQGRSQVAHVAHSAHGNVSSPGQGHGHKSGDAYSAYQAAMQVLASRPQPAAPYHSSAACYGCAEGYGPAGDHATPPAYGANYGSAYPAGYTAPSHYTPPVAEAAPNAGACGYPSPNAAPNYAPPPGQPAYPGGSTHYGYHPGQEYYQHPQAWGYYPQ